MLSKQSVSHTQAAHKIIDGNLLQPIQPDIYLQQQQEGLMFLVLLLYAAFSAENAGNAFETQNLQTESTEGVSLKRKKSQLVPLDT